MVQGSISTFQYWHRKKLGLKTVALTSFDKVGALRSFTCIGTWPGQETTWFRDLALGPRHAVTSLISLDRFLVWQPL